MASITTCTSQDEKDSPLVCEIIMKFTNLHNVAPQGGGFRIQYHAAVKITSLVADLSFVFQIRITRVLFEQGVV